MDVTARSSKEQERLAWGELYHYTLFFQTDSTSKSDGLEALADLDTLDILNFDPLSADLLHRLVYPGHPLPSFVLPPKDLNQLKILHGSCRKSHGVGKEMLSENHLLYHPQITQSFLVHRCVKLILRYFISVKLNPLMLGITPIIPV